MRFGVDLEANDGLADTNGHCVLSISEVAEFQVENLFDCSTSSPSTEAIISPFLFSAFEDESVNVLVSVRELIVFHFNVSDWRICRDDFHLFWLFLCTFGLEHGS